MKKRPQLTGRAAILAVVVCAIAMSLAYPVREYVAQRRQIAQLERQQAQALQDLRALEERSRRLDDPAYIRQLLRGRLHYCGDGRETCYVLLDQAQKARQPAAGASRQQAGRAPWYQTLWESVEAADRGTGERVEMGARTPAP
ncbi:septation ring formation regulator EzrA [Sphaerisporangium melleum]|uniref:Septation ring formation regulator EzrA n=1 Tax=Sphaerisporangium melleum TaxID=321316 RepID=A0A917VFF1_9ACTN|nr:septum formation initiator family protein [Sphaerisporangium melleum]GGK69265.1 septation ring formation regulator EzrA [Sphaerisporangium melleum]GII68994.1 septation ring formation regulator EzrA [Sphaerisporangium melleum]